MPAREHFCRESVGMLGVLVEGCDLDGDRVLPVRVRLRGKSQKRAACVGFLVALRATVRVLVFRANFFRVLCAAWYSLCIL